MNLATAEQPLDEPDDIAVEETAKTLRCDQFYYSDPPRCYSENTSKEELVLEHVIEYKRQFKVIYDPLRKLLLVPKNERGKRKFICTTIRPTKLPFTELYDWEKTAKFVADFIEYEELEEPDKFPSPVQSPANTLEWQAGDAFDMSIVLCSLLCGAGYDAFVVHGTAPAKITTKDESLMDCPFSLEINDAEENDDPEVDEDEKLMENEKKDKVIPVDDFKVEAIVAPYSTFDKGVREKQEEQDRIAKIKATVIDDDEPDFMKEDRYGRTRKHCWVYIAKGKRELSESFFVEPSTGRKYTVENAPYHSIEAIFNHKNYWINMDPSKELAEVNMDFEYDTNGEWEYVMIKSDEKKEDDDDDAAPDDDDEEGEEGANNDEEVLDMPPPWSPKLHVNKEQFIQMTPKGEKAVFYKKCKVEYYADCSQVDGLVKRVSIYEDYKRLLVKEIRSYYRFRRDKLILRRRFPYEFKTIEHYEQSEKSNNWKKLIQVDDRYRKIYFYHHRNKDGLIYREEQIKVKTFERYKGREDKLIYRSVTFADDEKQIDEA